MKRVRLSGNAPRETGKRPENPAKRTAASAPDLSRVRQRPDPESWGFDELLTLAEAALLHWPPRATYGYVPENGGARQAIGGSHYCR